MRWCAAYDDLTIASLRFHWIKSRADVRRIYDANDTNFWRYLGAYTDPVSAVRCLPAGDHGTLQGPRGVLHRGPRHGGNLAHP